MKTELVLAGLALVSITACDRDNSSRTEGQIKQYEAQIEAFDRQTRRVDEMQAKTEDQIKRMDKILDKYEEQARRRDAILDKMERDNGLKK